MCRSRSGERSARPALEIGTTLSGSTTGHDGVQPEDQPDQSEICHQRTALASRHRQVSDTCDMAGFVCDYPQTGESFPDANS